MRLDADGFAERGRVAVEMALKPRIAGNRNRTGAGSIVVGFTDGAAEKCGHAKDGKVAAGDKIDVGRLVRGAGDGSFAGELACYLRPLFLHRMWLSGENRERRNKRTVATRRREPRW